MSKVIIISVPPMVEEKDWSFAQRRLQGNKAVRPMEDQAWLLQGLIKCGICGMSFRADTWNHGNYHYRHYECRGKLKQSHLDGSPRCSTRRLKADWLEEQVWLKIKEVLNDPNKLEPIIKETIDSLSLRAKDIEARIHPVNIELSRIANQKARLADDFVRLNMNDERYRELQQSLNQEEARLRSILGDVDPIQMEELKLTVAWLGTWQKQLKDMSWNLENEDGSRARTVDRPHDLVIKLVDIESEEVSEAVQFPAKRRRLLDKLQVRLVVFHDRIEINAIFPFESIALGEHQKYPST